MRSALVLVGLAASIASALLLLVRLQSAKRRIRHADLQVADLQAQLERLFGQERLRRFEWDLDADRIRAVDVAGQPHIRGTDVLGALHPDDQNRLRAALERARRVNEQLLEEVRYRATETSPWQTYLTSARLVTDGDGSATLRGIAVDLSSTRLLEHEARESEQRFLALAESMPQIVYVTRHDGRIEYFNRRWREYTGLESAESDVLDEVVHPDDHGALAAAWSAALSSGDELTAEFRLKRASDGQYNWFLTRAVPMKDASGTVLRWYGTSTDIEDIRAARAKLEHADQMKDEFLATLAHELRNPLAPIRNAVTVMQMSTTHAEVPWAVELIDRQTHHMTRLIDDLMDVSRISAGLLELHRSEVSLLAVVQEALEQRAGAADAARHTITFSAAADLSVQGDRARLVQVLSNLLNNAAKYSDRGTRIDVSLRQEQGQAVICVADQGVGLQPEQLESIFDMFVQVKDSKYRSSGGLGIGLSLVRRLVQLHGGFVTGASPGLGKGSTFTVRLPLLTPSADAAPLENLITSPAQNSGIRILLVDDGEDALSSMATLLSTRGATIETASLGGAVVALAESFRPDVIILDISLPDVDGYEVCRRVRAEPWGRAVAMIALTGWGTQEDRARAAAAGFDRHVVKPAHPDDLIRLSHELRRD